MTDLALPLHTTSTGELATVEAGSVADVRQRAALVCATPPGTIDLEPGYGLYDQAFRKGGADIAEIKAQLDRWVPDAAAVLDEDPTTLDQALEIIGVKVASA